MPFIPAVGRGDYQQIADGEHLAVGGFVRKDAQTAAYIQFPDDVGRTVVLERLTRRRPCRSANNVIVSNPRICVCRSAQSPEGNVAQSVEDEAEKSPKPGSDDRCSSRSKRSAQSIIPALLWSRGGDYRVMMATAFDKRGAHNR